MPDQKNKSSQADILPPQHAIAEKLQIKPSQKIEIPKDVIERMSQAAARVAKTLSVEFDKKLVEMRTEARARNNGWQASIYSQAHDIRGLAKTFGAPHAGAFAADLCVYVEALPSADQSDESIMLAYVEAIVSGSRNGVVDETAKQLRSELAAMVKRDLENG